jgi:hypothetical protein
LKNKRSGVGDWRNLLISYLKKREEYDGNLGK